MNEHPVNRPRKGKHALWRSLHHPRRLVQEIFEHRLVNTGSHPEPRLRIVRIGKDNQNLLRQTVFPYDIQQMLQQDVDARATGSALQEVFQRRKMTAAAIRFHQSPSSCSVDCCSAAGNLHLQPRRMLSCLLADDRNTSHYYSSFCCNTPATGRRWHCSISRTNIGTSGGEVKSPQVVTFANIILI